MSNKTERCTTASETTIARINRQPIALRMHENGICPTQNDGATFGSRRGDSVPDIQYHYRAEKDLG
jgi:hypothetical protein